MVVVAIGALGILGYNIYQSKKTPKETPIRQINETTVHRSDVTPAHKFEMEYAIKWTRKVSLMICTKQWS